MTKFEAPRLKPSHFLLSAVFTLFAMTISCGSIVIDRSANALESNDTSVIIEGCGQQPISGYTYCRKSVGDHTSRDDIIFHVPRANCDRDSCVEISVFFPNGSPAYRVAIRSDQVRHRVSWARLSGKSSFDRNDRGFWLIVQDVQWKDNNGANRRTVSQGEIRLRVMADGYQSLHNAQGSRWFAFEWSDGDYRMGVSTAGRSSVWHD